MSVSMTKTTPAPLHESFTTDFGTLAMQAHARGEHSSRASLVCKTCRTEGGR